MLDTSKILLVHHLIQRVVLRVFEKIKKVFFWWCKKQIDLLKHNKKKYLITAGSHIKEKCYFIRQQFNKYTALKRKIYLVYEKALIPAFNTLGLSNK